MILRGRLPHSSELRTRRRRGNFNEIGFANAFPNPAGWETRLLRRFAPRNDSEQDSHREPAEGGRGNLTPSVISRLPAREAVAIS